MRTSAVLHWLYCAIQANLGNQIVIKRDSLRSMYQVNKYGIHVTLDNDNIDAVTAQVKLILEKAGYVKDDWETWTREIGNQQVRISMWKSDGLYLNPSVYPLERK